LPGCDRSVVRYCLAVPSHDLRAVPVASSVIEQIAGLIGRRERADLFLFIPRCRSVHTWFMRSAIDIVFLDADSTVVGVVEDARPWRTFRGPLPARAVLELPPGYARELGVSVGDHVNLDET
jgi:uncharacterized membrane protein (UPF0127 family)